MENKYYGSIDGLRAIASVGIVMMHMKENNVYKISGYIYNVVISSFTNFVFLFMTISAFGMCCGYYEKIVKGRISIEAFYQKRFQKIFPFFAFLVLIDFLINPSIEALYESFVNLTLLFGLLPDAGDISVIGVGWFLGLIFVFYLCFPFFCYLLKNRRRLWMAFGISLIYNFVCTQYFEVGRTNILYSACFFLAGGMVYVYKDKITALNRWVMLGGIYFAVVIYYFVGGNTVTWLLVSMAFLVYALLAKGGILENRITKFLGNISMEIYLSHMVVFRVIEKLQINRLFGDGMVQYAITVIVVLAGTITFSIVVKRIFCLISRFLEAGGQLCLIKN